MVSKVLFSLSLVILIISICFMSIDYGIQIIVDGLSEAKVDEDALGTALFVFGLVLSSGFIVLVDDNRTKGK